MSLWTPSYRLFQETLTRLCRWTTPHGYEHMLLPMLPTPPHGAAPGTDPAYLRGSFKLCVETGNYWVTIPGPGQDILWTCHLDTVGSVPEPVNLVQDKHELRSDGTTILGADDKVGVAILCLMIRAGVPGTYAFFVGEESGCIGSTAAAAAYAKRLDGKTDKVHHPYHGTPFRACISLDRRGTDSVITSQMGERCCGEKWAKALAKSINHHFKGAAYKPDDTGVYTDSASYMSHIDHCTNLSVGYYNQHGNSEHVDMQHAYMLCLALIALGRGSGVPDIKRDRKAEDKDDWSVLGGGSYMRYHGGAKRWWSRSKKSDRDATDRERIRILEDKIDELMTKFDGAKGSEREDVEDEINELDWELYQLREGVAERDNCRYDSTKYQWDYPTF